MEKGERYGTPYLGPRADPVMCVCGGRDGLHSTRCPVTVKKAAANILDRGWQEWLANDSAKRGIPPTTPAEQAIEIAFQHAQAAAGRPSLARLADHWAAVSLAVLSDPGAFSLTEARLPADLAASQAVLMGVNHVY